MMEKTVSILLQFVIYKAKKYGKNNLKMSSNKKRLNSCMNAIRHKNKWLVCVTREQAEVCLEIEDLESVIKVRLARGCQGGGCGHSART